MSLVVPVGLPRPETGVLHDVVRPHFERVKDNLDLLLGRGEEQVGAVCGGRVVGRVSR